MAHAWLFCGVGALFCFSGVIIYHKNIFEEGKKLYTSIVLMIIGLILIAVGTEKYLNFSN